MKGSIKIAAYQDIVTPPSNPALLSPPKSELTANELCCLGTSQRIASSNFAD